MQGEKKRIKLLVILVTALLFGGLHATVKTGAWYLLAVGTFVLAMYYGWLYLTKKNIFILGLFHGWLGAIIFYTVIDRDPWTEVFASVLQPHLLAKINIAGLAVDLLGATIMFLNSPFASTKPPVVSSPDAITASGHWLGESKREEQKRRWLKVGFGVLLFGFFLQFFAAWFSG